MQASGVTALQLLEAAQKVGVKVDVSGLNSKGTRHRVKVNPGVYATPDEALTPKGNRRRDERGDLKYQRMGATNDTRRVSAVCWHGFRDFFRAVFELAPEATFRTAMDTWKGREDFEARYRSSGLRRVGSAFHPTLAAEACRCPESGMAV